MLFDFSSIKTSLFLSLASTAQPIPVGPAPTTIKSIFHLYLPFNSKFLYNLSSFCK